MAPWRWAMAGVVLGSLAAVVWLAPARWLADGLARASGHQVVLADARGTVWSGSSRLVLSGGAGSLDQAALPGRVRWRIGLHGWGLRLRVEADCCTEQPLALVLRPTRRGGTLQVADGRSQWPAALLTGLGTPWNTLHIDGELRLSTEGLSLEWADGRLRMSGRAECAALRVSSRLSTIRPMGSYRITLATGDVPTLTLSTIEGSLLLSGQGQWLGGKLRFEGEASAAPEREAALANLLNIIGRRSGERSIIRIG